MIIMYNSLDKIPKLTLSPPLIANRRRLPILLPNLGHQMNIVLCLFHLKSVCKHCWPFCKSRGILGCIGKEKDGLKWYPHFTQLICHRYSNQETASLCGHLRRFILGKLNVQLLWKEQYKVLATDTPNSHHSLPYTHKTFSQEEPIQVRHNRTRAHAGNCHTCAGQLHAQRVKIALHTKTLLVTWLSA